VPVGRFTVSPPPPPPDAGRIAIGGRDDGAVIPPSVARPSRYFAVGHLRRFGKSMSSRFSWFCCCVLCCLPRPPRVCYPFGFSLSEVSGDFHRSLIFSSPLVLVPSIPFLPVREAPRFGMGSRFRCPPYRLEGHAGRESDVDLWPGHRLFWTWGSLTFSPILGMRAVIASHIYSGATVEAVMSDILIACAVRSVVPVLCDSRPGLRLVFGLTESALTTRAASSSNSSPVLFPSGSLSAVLASADWSVSVTTLACSVVLRSFEA